MDGEKTLDTALLQKSMRNTDRLQDIYITEEFSDVVFEIISENKVEEFRAHKLVLSMASQQFEAWFYESWPHNLSKVTIKNLDPKYFEAVLRFIYTDEFHVESTLEAIDVAYAADQFAVDELLFLCLNYIQDNLNPLNIWESYKLALKIPSEQLLDEVVTFVAKQENILSLPEFVYSDEEVLESVMTKVGQNVSHRTIFIALVSWATHHLGAKSKNLDAVRAVVMPYLPCIDFLSFTPEEFSTAMEPPLVFSDEEFASIALNIIGMTDRPLPSWCGGVYKKKPKEKMTSDNNRKMKIIFNVKKN